MLPSNNLLTSYNDCLEGFIIGINSMDTDIDICNRDTGKFQTYQEKIVAREKDLAKQEKEKRLIELELQDVIDSAMLEIEFDQAFINSNL